MSDPVVTPADLRAHALARTLGPRGSLQAALDCLGFVQADPIRAPARAQDLILMQRVRAYRAGDLERRYPELNVEEDYLPNYGFFPREVQALMHPREVGALRVEQHAPGLSAQVLDFVRARGEAHPREVQAHFGSGNITNAWGGQSSASTRALDALHHQGLLRVSRRVNGVRLYAPAHHLDALRAAPQPEAARLRALVHLLVRLYAPLPEASLGYLVGLSGWGVGHLRASLRATMKAVVREELTRARVDGLTYLWPPDEAPAGEVRREVRLVAPFDPLVWDRRRFAHLHGWTYRFEAYTPAPKRQLGYYALPLFYAERAVGWANLKVAGGTLTAQVGTTAGQRHTAAFTRALTAELERHRVFLGATDLDVTVS